MAQLKAVPTTTPQEKKTHTSVDTIVLTPELVGGLKTPPFQRPIRINDKVRALAVQIKNEGGVLPGVITIGVFERQKYKLDGQHRLEAFLLSECQEGYCDVRYRYFDSMAEMGEEFVRLNSQLVTMKPDDILRGLEGSSEGMTLIREKCKFVGYDQIRRHEKSPLVSMSSLLRCWHGSGHELPRGGGASAATIAGELTIEEAQQCVDFLHLAERAWGRDQEYGRLWGTLNLTLCMWLYRRVVMAQWSTRIPKLSKDQFYKCLMSVSASADYIEWLLGRNLTDRDRSPAYGRIKRAFVKRIEEDTGKKVLFPSPPWAHHAGGHQRPA